MLTQLQKKRYTIEFGARFTNNCYVYCITQVQGFCNREQPKYIYNMIEDILNSKIAQKGSNQ